MSVRWLLFGFGFVAASALLAIGFSLLVTRTAAMRTVERVLAAGLLWLAATATFVIIFRFE
jgi:hypothetical protein